MRILWLGLSAVIVGVAATGVIAFQATLFNGAGAKRDTVPDYTFEDMLTICSEKQTVDERHERYAVVHDQLEQSLRVIWNDPQALRREAQSFREIAVLHAPSYDQGVRVTFPGEDADQIYAHCLLQMVASRLQSREDYKRFQLLAAQFEREFQSCFEIIGQGADSGGGALTTTVPECP